MGIPIENSTHLTLTINVFSFHILIFYEIIAQKGGLFLQLFLSSCIMYNVHIRYKQTDIFVSDVCN